VNNYVKGEKAAIGCFFRFMGDPLHFIGNPFLLLSIGKASWLKGAEESETKERT
jgi:hypothetical protein